MVQGTVSALSGGSDDSALVTTTVTPGSNLSLKFLHSTYPSELTIWVNPLEVSYRIGENEPIAVLYEYGDGVSWFPKSLKKTKKRKWINAFCKHKKKEMKTLKTDIKEMENALENVNLSSTSNNLKMDYLLDPKGTVDIEQLATLIAN